MPRSAPVTKADPGAVTTDPRAAARAAHLRYVDHERPGITRRRAGRAFSYRAPDGVLIRDRDELRRIRALAIPPAWSDVWISPHPHGHIQATGRDARGRKQYRYHARWRQVRDESKYGRTVAFADALPAIRARVEHDLALRGLPREKVLAAVVKLLDTTYVRVGNAEYARHNETFGLTTLRNEHLQTEGGPERFTFRGKHGKEHTVPITDRRLRRIVKQCHDLPGQELLEYRDPDGTVHDIDSGDVNAYLHEITGDSFTAKDFRTWAGTKLAAQELQAVQGRPRTARRARRAGRPSRI